MNGNAINAKSEALQLHELFFAELDAVSGGDNKTPAPPPPPPPPPREGRSEALVTFERILQEL
jgi:hypothetical protein